MELDSVIAKRRGFCPSCAARRMAETAAYLVDRVIPRVPVRQWVLSFPIPLRILLAAHPELLTPVPGIVHRVITGFLVEQAGLRRGAAEAASVTLIERFGSAANLNMQLHGLVLEGGAAHRGRTRLPCGPLGQDGPYRRRRRGEGGTAARPDRCRGRGLREPAERPADRQGTSRGTRSPTSPRVGPEGSSRCGASTSGPEAAESSRRASHRGASTPGSTRARRAAIRRDQGQRPRRADAALSEERRRPLRQRRRGDAQSPADPDPGCGRAISERSNRAEHQE